MTVGRMAVVIRPMASAMLITKPVLVSMARMPEPMPRLAGGTTPITALVLGELKRPEPAPTMSCQTTSCQIGVSTAIVISPARPTAVTSIPAVASTREP